MRSKTILSRRAPVRAINYLIVLIACFLVIIAFLLGAVFLRRYPNLEITGASSSGRAPSADDSRRAARFSQSVALTLQIPPAAGDDERVSNEFEHQEFQGDALTWGTNNHQPTAAACAASCLALPKCNVWVWCGVAAGCTGNEYGQHEVCWLKRQAALDPVQPDGAFTRKDIRWTSGIVATARQMREALAKHKAREQGEWERIKALRANTSLPMVFMDVEMKGVPLGRMEFVLFTHTSPLAAENFRAMCSEERDGVSLKGAYFYRIIDRFIDQSGSNAGSVYTSSFNDEPGALALKHDRPGLLSLANGGPNTNGGHFSIVVAPAPHLNGHYGIFGEVVSGWDVMYKINAESCGQPDNTAGRDAGIMITRTGQLRYGTASAPLQALYPATSRKLVKKPDELYAGPPAPAAAS